MPGYKPTTFCISSQVIKPLKYYTLNADLDIWGEEEVGIISILKYGQSI